MPNTFADPVKQEIWATLRALNATWTQGNPADLKDYFHPDMVAVTATDRTRLLGQSACIAAWKGFAAAARIHYWRELDPDIRLYGAAAVVTYYFEMSFDMNGQTITSSGRDMFFFINEKGRWWAVADQFSTYPCLA